MSSSTIGPDRRDGVIRVVPEGDGIVAVSLEGEFDLAKARALGEEIDRALDDGNSLVLDLDRVTFIDSSVIKVLLRAARSVGGRGQTIVLQLGTAAVVERALDIVGIERVLTRTRDRQEAVQIIRRRTQAA